ncbi:MAG: UvrD-helicase domain-containing protein [Chloroflexales bacterium]
MFCERVPQIARPLNERATDATVTPDAASPVAIAPCGNLEARQPEASGAAPAAPPPPGADQAAAPTRLCDRRRARTEEVGRLQAQGWTISAVVPHPAAPANPNQRAAITTTDGPLLIIAGPGAGKTFTLVERVVYLITAKAVTPEQLMVVTFTDKAAQELTTRIAHRFGELGVRFNLNEMYLGTFHAICLRWLQDHHEHTRLKRNFTLFDQFDQHYFLYQHLRDYEAIPASRCSSATRRR